MRGRDFAPTTHRTPLCMDGQHDLGRQLPVHAEKGFKYFNHKLHWQSKPLSFQYQNRYKKKVLGNSKLHKKKLALSKKLLLTLVEGPNRKVQFP